MDEDPTLEAAKWLEDEKPEEADKAALIQPDAAEEMKDYDVILNNFEGDAPAEPSHLDTPPEAISSPVADEDTSNGPSGLPDANMEEQISLPVESDEISDEAHKPTVEISRSNSPLSVTQSPHPTARNEENVSEGKRGGISQENDAQDDFHQKVSTSGDKEEDYKTEGETPSEVDGAISRPAPLPPIEKQSTSQTMLKSGSRASLPRSSHASSRPLTASLYQRPLSRPMSERLSVAEILGHAQEAAAAPESPRGSLPALVKTSSAPSSRPISAKLPPLSRPVSAKAADGELSVLNKDDGRSSASRAEAVTPGRVSRSSSARVQKPTPPTSSRPQSRISGSMARGLDKKLSELAQESQEAPKENQVDGDAADGEVESRNVSRRSSASLRADPARLSATGGEKDSEEAQATSVNDEPLEELAISHESLVGGTPEEEQATEETPKDNASNSEDVPPESAPAGKSRPHSVISAEHIADVVTENPDAEEGTTSRHLTPVRSEDESKDGQEAPQAESSARNSPKESVVLSTSGEVVEEQAGNMDEEEVELPDASLSVAQLTAAETSPVDASPSEEDDPPHSKRRTPISRASLSRPSSTGIIDRSPDKLAEAKPPTRPASQKSSRLSGSRASSVNSKRRLEKQKGRSAKDLADGDHDVSANDTMVPGNEEVTENGAAVGLDQDGEEEGEVESTSGKVVEATDERDSSRRSSVKISGLPELPKAVSEL
ncbi:hypothetical protein DFJ73DRAFT_809685 [Zopfochytrium polystomum]|nr:hypothetical protein DFJ73DRAFT_809685 [Zopfochytrium polystomum]